MPVPGGPTPALYSPEPEEGGRLGLRRVLRRAPPDLGTGPEEEAASGTGAAETEESGTGADEEKELGGGTLSTPEPPVPIHGSRP